MKVAVIGAQGMLGKDIAALFGREHQVESLDIDEVDITSRPQVLQVLRHIQPNLIINSAALVNVDTCQDNPDAAWQVNAFGAQNLAFAARDLDATLIYISTDYVFDGTSTRPYREFDTPNPINAYGESKLYGEILARSLCPKLYIVRSSWIFGNDPRSYVARILNAASQGAVEMTDDQIEAPTYTWHLAEALQRLYNSECYGLYHFTGVEGCTRVAFAHAVLEEAGIAQKVVRVPALPQRNTPRPAHVVLDCTLYSRAISPPPHWRDGVRAYFKHSA